MRQLLIALVGSLLLGGCAFASYTQWDPTTGKKILKITSGVVGTGETEQLVDGYGYSTSDTGVSDNATKLGGDLSKAAAMGALKSLVPLP